MKNNKLSPLMWFCSLVMVLLGFSGCSKDDPGRTPDEYGTPHADYKYMGTIVDEEGNPIKGIEAKLVGYNALTSSNEVAKFSTDENGKFESEYYSEMVASVSMLEIKDVDGEENGGEFLSETIPVSQMQSTKVAEGESKWHMGSFDRSVTVKLSIKEKDKQEVE